MSFEKEQEQSSSYNCLSQCLDRWVHFSIPVSIRYLMLHEKGSKIATAVSSRTWQSAPSQNEDGENEVE